MGSSSMTAARLQVNDGLGNRVVMLDKPLVAIGRRGENDVRLVGSDISRDHAEIAAADGAYILRDKGSRYGTFVNGEQVSERPLQHGDRIQFGRASGTDVVFLIEDSPPPSSDKLHQTSVGDIRQLAALLEGLRALGSGPRPRRSARARARCRHRRDRCRARLHHAGQRRRRARNEARAREGQDHDAGQPLRDEPQDSRRRICDRDSSRSWPTCSTAILPTCTWGRWRSASVT